MESYRFTYKGKEPQRLDKVLQQQLPQFSRRYLRRLIDQGSVYVDNKRVRKQSKILIPDRTYQIQVYNYDGSAVDAIARTVEWEKCIIYRDENLLVVNKPSGIPSAPTRESAIHNVYAYLEKARLLPKIYYPFHRLDKGTTGLLMIPLTRWFTRELNRQLQEKKIRKTYFALVEGIPEKEQWTVEGYISNPHGIYSPARFSTSPQPGFLYSCTHFWREIANPQRGISLIRIEPETGRTHQIRVHLQASQLGVIGDPIYRSANSQHYKAPHLLLHCFEMEFFHPGLQQTITLRAPFPETFINYGTYFFPHFPSHLKRIIAGQKSSLFLSQ